MKNYQNKLLLALALLLLTFSLTACQNKPQQEPGRSELTTDLLSKQPQTSVTAFFKAPDCPVLVPLVFVGTVALILLCQIFWVGGVQPGGVVLCIILFSTPVESYVTYALNRIFDTGIGVIMALVVNSVFPGGFTFRFMERFYRLFRIPGVVADEREPG